MNWPVFDLGFSKLPFGYSSVGPQALEVNLILLWLDTSTPELLLNVPLYRRSRTLFARTQVDPNHGSKMTTRKNYMRTSHETPQQPQVKSCRVLLNSCTHSDCSGSTRLSPAVKIIHSVPVRFLWAYGIMWPRNVHPWVATRILSRESFIIQIFASSLSQAYSVMANV
jgi:hypothetical protein